MYTWLHIQCAASAYTYNLQPARMASTYNVQPAYLYFFFQREAFHESKQPFFALNLLYVTSASEVKLLRNFAFSINVTII